jgi:hypothetical protein
MLEKTAVLSFSPWVVLEQLVGCVLCLAMFKRVENCNK